MKGGTTYLYYKGTPLYPFGYGLSYTSFSYANLTLNTPAISLAAVGTPCGSVQVGVDVTNSGARDGDEVVQLYVAFPSSSLQRPLKQLRGFRRVSIAAGQTQHVSFEVAASAFTYWDETAGAFAIEAGVPAEVQVGASSADIRLRATLNVTP
jgi:beta-glucosidase